MVRGDRRRQRVETRRALRIGPGFVQSAHVGEDVRPPVKSRSVGVVQGDCLRQLRERADPILRPASGQTVRDAFDEELPRRGQAPDEALDECEALFPYDTKGEV